MRLYTIHHKNSFKKLLTQRILPTDAHYIDQCFLNAYDWMIKQAQIRGLQLTTYPVWAAPSKEDLFQIWRLRSFTEREYVLITFEVDERQCLHSVYSAWEEVLVGGCFIYYSLAEEQAFYQSLNLDDDALYHLDTLPAPFDIEKSYERIFELEKFPNEAIQTITPQLTAAMVKRIEFLNDNPYYTAF